MFAPVCSRKMMGPSHASDFLPTTKVHIQLWSSLNRLPGPVEPETVQQMAQRAWEPTSPAHHPLGRSEPAATNALVEDEAVATILGMNQKYILPAQNYGFFHFFSAKKFSFLPTSPLLFTSPPSYLPLDFELSPELSPKLESRWNGSKASALEARAGVGVEPARWELEREQSRAWSGPTNLDMLLFYWQDGQLVHWWLLVHSGPSIWCPLWLRVVQQMAKLNQHPPAYHPVDAHDDFQCYDSSF